MKSKYLRVKVVLILITIMVVFWISSCQKQHLIDPFWQINLTWEKNTVTYMLYEGSKKGEITNCVFSFEKEFYVKNKNLDAKIYTSLYYPDFDKNNLKVLKYSLVANFRNETIPEFNPSFFDYFKQEMVSSYGNITDKYEKDDKIFLNWEIENNKINATVIKDINHYIIKVVLNN